VPLKQLVHTSSFFWPDRQRERAFAEFHRSSLARLQTSVGFRDLGIIATRTAILFRAVFGLLVFVIFANFSVVEKGHGFLYAVVGPIFLKPDVAEKGGFVSGPDKGFAAKSCLTRAVNSLRLLVPVARYHRGVEDLILRLRWVQWSPCGLSAPRWPGRWGADVMTGIVRMSRIVVRMRWVLP